MSTELWPSLYIQVSIKAASACQGISKKNPGRNLRPGFTVKMSLIITSANPLPLVRRMLKANHTINDFFVNRPPLIKMNILTI